jgi:hypothetical protein
MNWWCGANTGAQLPAKPVGWTGSLDVPKLCLNNEGDNPSSPVPTTFISQLVEDMLYEGPTPRVGLKL